MSATILHPAAFILKGLQNPSCNSANMASLENQLSLLFPSARKNLEHKSPCYAYLY